MSDTETISFTASGELAEWLREEAEREMKTVSSLTEDLVAQKVQEIREQRIQGVEGPQLTVIQFEEMEKAREFREDFSHWIHESDDHRSKDVHLQVPDDRHEEILSHPDVEAIKPRKAAEIAHRE